MIEFNFNGFALPTRLVDDLNRAVLFDTVSDAWSNHLLNEKKSPFNGLQKDELAWVLTLQEVILVPSVYIVEPERR